MIIPKKKTVYIIFLLLWQTLSTTAQFPHWEWARRYGGDGGIKKGFSIAIDDNDNIYIAGSFYGGLTLAGSTLNSVGQDDIFIAKFDKSGNLSWIRQASGPIHDKAITVTVQGNFIYVAGSFDLEVTFEDIHIETDHTLGIFLAKYDLEGNLVWIHYEGPGGSGACIQGLNITSDNNEHLYITGCLIHKGLNDSYDDDIFIAKYDTAGNMIWVTQEGGNSFEGGQSLIVDKYANIYNTGYFKDTVFFSDTTLISIGDRDIYISKYDSSGNLIWIKQAGGILPDVGSSIATDNNNDIYVTGSFYETADFGDTILTSRGFNDIFILKLDQNGNRKWIKHFGGSGIDYGNVVHTDIDDNLYLVGNFQETISIGDTSLTSNSTYEYATNAFISKFKNNGEFVWVKKVGSYWDMIEGLVTYDKGNVYVTGSVYYTTVYLDDIILSPVGNADFFMAKITENPVITEEMKCKPVLKIYPNPANELVNIQISAKYGGNYILEVISVTGITMIRKKLTSNGLEIKEQLDLQDFSPGIYLVNIIGNEFFNTTKLIKQ